MSNRHLSPLVALKGNQKLASEPGEQVWLSASAGTGKTHVLTARVMRLLLSGADPSTILCLTFTKAGAAEMADRIHARLAHWVRLPNAELAADLKALGEDFGPDQVAFARTLFARVLDASGPGLRIQTIHSFCQTLLAGFPVEAGLIPGFRALEGREEAHLARETLANLLVAAETQGDGVLITALQMLSRRLGEGGAESFLMNCARAPQAMADLGDDVDGAIRAKLDVPEGDIDAVIAARCSDAEFDIHGLNRIAAANAVWGTATGLKNADKIVGWLSVSFEMRAATLDQLGSVVLTGKGEPKADNIKPKLLDAEPNYTDYATRLGDVVLELQNLRSRAALAALLGPALRAGQAYASAYAEAKRQAAVVDFDDLIRKTVMLLGQSHMAQWIRYKLDQATDHILVDEAQDTNAQQWAIIRVLAEEFFATENNTTDKVRTIFSVGDFKQAIFGFQGTSPLYFEAASYHFSQLAKTAGRTLHALSLSDSFRSTAPVLELVDQLLGSLGHEALGLSDGAEPHRSAVVGPGIVTLWDPVAVELADIEDDEGEEGWLDDATRSFATKLARQIRHWLDEPIWLDSKGRTLQPEDILILVRRRSELAPLIVARLHAENVPVAGVDRLRLNAPLAVQDLLAAIRFALQPDDDLNFASLLVSPILGWSQDDLMEHGIREKGKNLYRHVREKGALSGDTAAAISEILNMADLTTPYQFLENILSGRIQGRRKLLARLGAEARDPIEELLNAALQFENDAAPSLQLFLDWFDRGDVDIVRDASAPQNAVRVMTAHGAKGLQAPLVILADATVDPSKGPRGKLDWEITEGSDPIPVFRPRKDELSGSLLKAADDLDRRELEEHWRLLYVAMTRAEEKLFIGGALGSRAKGEPPKNSWYAAISKVFGDIGVETGDDGVWNGARHYIGNDPVKPVSRKKLADKMDGNAPSILPDWIRKNAPEEARPPRPLAPSSLGIDSVANPPPGPAMRKAAERGKILHALFERLPNIAPDRRLAAARVWLEHSGGISDEGEREDVADAALRIINDPVYADIFGPDALAEAPIAAVVQGQVIAGTVDRLVISNNIVRVVDFKTGRRVPETVDKVPEHHLRQMSAYVETLKIIFPGQMVEAALLYTSGPKLLSLSETLLERYKPDYVTQEESLVLDG